MADLANSQANLRSRAGLSRQLQVDRTDLPPDPSRGGQRGFPLWFRQQAITMYHTHGEDGIQNLGCSMRSVRRWLLRDAPYRMTGGKQREALTGVDQLLLCTFVFIYPNASADACSAYIINNGGAVYTPQQITTRLKELELNRKRASTEAYDAYSPNSLLRARLFWTQPPPLGVVGVNRRMLIDVDECSVTLESVEDKYGRAHPTARVRKLGHYTRGVRVNVLMAVEAGDPRLPPLVDGSTMKPRRWVSVTEDNCTAFVYADFIDSICRDLEVSPAPGDIDDYRIFMWDNLTAHHAPIVAQLVEGRPTANRFDIVPRPPYQPKYGPIEYVFCELAATLTRQY
jgi:hypothetical protein